MSAYMRDQFAYLGVATPQRRALTAGFLKTQKTIDWGFIEQCWDLPEREYQYLAVDLVVKLKRTLAPLDVPRLKALMTSKSWWDTVDALDSVVGDIAGRYPEMDAVMRSWGVDENLWVRRAAIDHQLLRKQATNTWLLEEIIVANLGQGEFFINKAIGWALRDYSKTNPDWVRDFISRHRPALAPLSIKEASKYI